MAQDALKAAKEASRQAREERMASVGALPIDRATSLRSASGTGALGAAGGRLTGSGAGSGGGDRQQGTSRNGSSTRGPKKGGGRRQGRSGGDAAGHHVPRPSARKDGGGASCSCRVAAHCRARRSRVWASDGHQAQATASSGVGAALKARGASPCSRARCEEGIQCSDEQ
jgi:hypothetical protein